MASEDFKTDTKTDEITEDDTEPRSSYEYSSIIKRKGIVHHYKIPQDPKYLFLKERRQFVTHMSTDALRTLFDTHRSKFTENTLLCINEYLNCRDSNPAANSYLSSQLVAANVEGFVFTDKKTSD